MARPQAPPPGILVVSVIYSSLDALADALKALEKRFGRVQYETMEIECAIAQNYSEEMGSGLMRRFFSFERQISRSSLPEIKEQCAKIEAQFADQVDDVVFRTVNVDPGVLCETNLVMAGYRDLKHRVFLRDDVYAEITLIHNRDHWARLPWTSTDFCHDEAVDFFDRARASFDFVEAGQT